MKELRPVVLVNGFLLLTLGLAMAVPVGFDLAEGNEDWKIFAIAAAFTIFVGGALTIAGRGEQQAGETALSVRQAFLLIVSVWISVTAFAALPLSFAGLGLSYTDAFFEAMSGITTTGATVMTGLVDTPPGIVIWRALRQWLGGIGIVVMAIAVLPMLQVGGRQLFKPESSDNSEKILPRATQIASGLTWLYVGMTAICFVGYWFSGMSAFDAIAHSMTTVSTGGYSTHDDSFGHFGFDHAEVMATIFMICGSLPFTLILVAVTGNPRRLWQDSQVRTFLGIVCVTTIVIVLWRWHHHEVLSWETLRDSAFNGVSVISGTGYASTDYNSWGPFAQLFFFCCMLIGGCAGSASCGIKVFRFQILYEMVKGEIMRIRHPHAVFIPRYNGRKISDDVTDSVMSFFFLFIACLGLIILALSATGLDLITAGSAAAATLANVGPGLGDIVGPTRTFQTLPATAKRILSVARLLGQHDTVAGLAR